MQMEFRAARWADLPAMQKIIDEGKAFLRSQGVDQWQKGAPAEEDLRRDIARGEGRVLCAGGRVAATLALLFREEEDYRRLLDGAWGQEVPYAALHRVAVAGTARGGGMAARLMREVKAACRARGCAVIRVDTHPRNIPMQRYLEKNGFVKRGRILLQSGAERGSERWAYDCEVP